MLFATWSHHSAPVYPKIANLISLDFFRGVLFWPLILIYLCICCHQIFIINTCCWCCEKKRNPLTTGQILFRNGCISWYYLFSGISVWPDALFERIYGPWCTTANGSVVDFGRCVYWSLLHRVWYGQQPCWICGDIWHLSTVTEV